jgi:hypothetical protein
MKTTLDPWEALVNEIIASAETEEIEFTDKTSWAFNGKDKTVVCLLTSCNPTPMKFTDCWNLSELMCNHNNLYHIKLIQARQGRQNGLSK